jgi:hypothetical protein
VIYLYEILEKSKAKRKVKKQINGCQGPEDRRMIAKRFKVTFFG